MQNKADTSGNRSNGSEEKSDSDKAGGVVQRRPRGRPRINQVVTQGTDPVARDSSSSRQEQKARTLNDSDLPKEDADQKDSVVRQRGRPRKRPYPFHNQSPDVLMGESAKDSTENEKVKEKKNFSKEAVVVAQALTPGDYLLHNMRITPARAKRISEDAGTSGQQQKSGDLGLLKEGSEDEKPDGTKEKREEEEKDKSVADTPVTVVQRRSVKRTRKDSFGTQAQDTSTVTKNDEEKEKDKSASDKAEDVVQRKPRGRPRKNPAVTQDTSSRQEGDVESNASRHEKKPKELKISDLPADSTEKDFSGKEETQEEQEDTNPLVSKSPDVLMGESAKDSTVNEKVKEEKKNVPKEAVVVAQALTPGEYLLHNMGFTPARAKRISEDAGTSDQQQKSGDLGLLKEGSEDEKPDGTKEKKEEEEKDKSVADTPVTVVQRRSVKRTRNYSFGTQAQDKSASDKTEDVVQRRSRGRPRKTPAVTQDTSFRQEDDVESSASRREEKSQDLKISDLPADSAKKESSGKVETKKEQEDANPLVSKFPLKVLRKGRSCPFFQQFQQRPVQITPSRAKSVISRVKLCVSEKKETVGTKKKEDQKGFPRRLPKETPVHRKKEARIKKPDF